MFRRQRRLYRPADEKLGFEDEGIRRGALQKNGTLRDQQFFGLKL
ncbi:MAG TPA: hypothetical protein QF604_08815 [Candidatus Latescibacteria bacterium]|nr:hypothetical protein [Candidatus Latescibacterota bacterium]MDP7633350.1 hypothetical protein [Candidatus Latescibacterota bacterium]HJN28005.1 hypothetical protein [Candidatus Latescibacterota bacterium]